MAASRSPARFSPTIAGTDQAYYGAPLDARQIVVDMQGSNPGANPLREMLTRYGG